MTKIVDSNILHEYIKDSREYALYVNKHRMIPDWRDGLKPVQRRILYTMYFNVKCINNFIKSNTVAGNTMVIHPHGDSAIYESMVIMGVPWKTKEVMVTSQGNYGSVQGDTPAASRYTEAKLSPYAVECIIGELSEIRSMVNWIPTNDNKLEEPEYFPSKVPNLLINGQFGIGYGLRCDIPTHCMTEVIDATIALIKNPKSDVYLIPDHNLPVEIINTDFKKIFNTGKGIYYAQGIIDIEKNGDRFDLVIKSIPNMAPFETIVEEIYKLIESKELMVHASPVNETRSNILRYIIPLKKGVDPVYSRDLLYAKTSIKKRYSVDFEVLDNDNNIHMSYREYLLKFIEFRKICKLKYYCNLLMQLVTRYHEKEAFVKFLKSNYIDKVITLIRNRNKSESDAELIEFLIKKVNITDLQAEYIINSPLKRLAKSNLPKFIEEAEKLASQIKYFEKIINSADGINNIIIEELNDIRNRYNRVRVSRVINDTTQEIPDGIFNICITDKGFIKKVPDGFEFKSNKDNVNIVLTTVSNVDTLYLFDEMGRVFSIPVHKIMPTDKNGLGVDVRTINKKCTSHIIGAIPKSTLEIKNMCIVSINTSGLIKRLSPKDFESVPYNGMLYTKIEQGDLVKKINACSDLFDVIVYSGNRALRFPIRELPISRRNTKGSKSMTSVTHIDGMNIIRPNSITIVATTGNGMVNKLDASILPRTKRYTGASRVIKLDKNDFITSVCGICQGESNLAYFTNLDTVDIPLSTIPDGSSVSKGTKMLPNGMKMIRQIFK